MLDISTLVDAADVNPVIKILPHTLHGWWLRPACSFRSAQAATLLVFHVPLTNYFVRRWFCVVHGPKPPLCRHNWLSFGKFQDTERFLIPWLHHVSSRLLPSGETFKYALAPSIKILGKILYLLICSFLLCLSCFLCNRVRNFWRDLCITLYLKRVSYNCWLSRFEFLLLVRIKTECVQCCSFVDWNQQHSRNLRELFISWRCK
jgi:hypothetical protein